jgi:hypothetical protein
LFFSRKRVCLIEWHFILLKAFSFLFSLLFSVKVRICFWGIGIRPAEALEYQNWIRTVPWGRSFG